MSSLRDQLLAKGLASKKDVRRVERELKDQRRQEQGHKQKARELQAQQEAARREAEAEAQQRRLEERRRREAEREARETRERVRQIVVGNAIRSRGPFRFHFRKLDGRTLGRLEVSERVAWKLRAGEAAIAAVSDDRGEEYVVISARGAQRLADIAPERVVFWTRETAGLSAPEEALWRPEWDISLRPHRIDGAG